MMIGGGTLTSSPSTKIILEDFPAGIFRCKTEIFPSIPRKTFHHIKFLRLDSAQSRILKPIPLRSSSIKDSQVNLEAEEIEALEKSPTKTVRVRFQLRKECVFGEHFFILGDDPVFGGLWDPENALPMNWSDGHVWTVDLELPVGRLVEFKFILKAKTGEVLWQPGPNRALETWETNKAIRICEDWENADLQMIIEEDFVPIVAGNITHQKQSVRLNTNVSSNGAEEEDEVVVDIVQQNSSVVVVENAGYVSDESAENSNSDTMEPSNGALTAREVTEETMSTEEESPVLVPGLIPLSDLEIDEVEVINEGKAETFPEVYKKQKIKEETNEKGKVKAISLFDKSEVEAVKSVEQRHYNGAEEEMQQSRLGTPDVLLEKDIQWGRRKLYKLLSNFGLF